MSSLVTVVLVFIFFILGFWLGVQAYREQLRNKL